MIRLDSFVHFVRGAKAYKYSYCLIVVGGGGGGGGVWGGGGGGGGGGLEGGRGT